MQGYYKNHKIRDNVVNIIEIRKRLADIKQRLSYDLPDELKRQANTFLIPTIAKRVSTTGVGGDGAIFSGYTADWAKKRKAKGKQVAFKSFDFLGNLWNTLGVVEVIKGKGRHTVVVNFDKSGIIKDGDRKNVRTRNARMVADAHSEREGKLIHEPNRQELDDYQKKITEWVNKIVIL